MKIRLSVYAQQNNVHYQTAWRWFRAGLIPGACKSVTGTIFVDENTPIPEIQQDDKQGLMTALLTTVTIFCDRIYGPQAQHKIDRVKEALKS